MCLKPLQLKLNQQKGGLPNGLLIYDRQTQTQIKVLSQYLLSYQQFHTFKSLPNRQPILQKFPTYLSFTKHFHTDNLLYQLICHSHIQMAICICMYNQDKQMLQNTLQGVGQNIYNLYKQGVDPDSIIVVILQDGIEKMDKTVLDMFQILQLESGIRLSLDDSIIMEEKIKKLEQIQKMRKNQLLIEEDDILNMDSFLFTAQQLQKRKKLRFINIKKQYQEVNKLLSDVKNLKKKKNITSQDLSINIFDFYLRLCYADFINKKQIQLKDKLPSNARQIVDQYYSRDIKKSKPFIQDALTKAQQFCQNYIKSRSQIAHTSFFRTSMFFPNQHTQRKSQKLLKKKDKPQQKYINNPEYINQSERQTFLKDQINKAIKMNIFFVIKYKNAQKLSSHNWFFNGFCKQFNNFTRKLSKSDQNDQVSPKFTILLDVGLRPDSIALVKMYNTMSNHPQIGGVCGYMGLKIQKTSTQHSQNMDFLTSIFLNFVDIQRAQQLQYHFAHLIDKGFQSIFKFIHVLPGAFSGYNMKAIWGQNKKNADDLLLDYFSSINDKLSIKQYKTFQLSFVKVIARIFLPNFIVKSNIKQQQQTHEDLMYSSNVNLAEDRILCMGIHKNNKNLIFLPDAYSFVDPVKDLPGLMGQRKRWINGSYFAFDKVSDQLKQMNKCCHILAFMNLLAYIAPGFFLFTISIAMQAFKADVLVYFFQSQLSPSSNIYGAFVYTINFIYTLFIGGLIFYSINLNNRNKEFIRFVYSLSTLLGLISVVILCILTVDIIRGLNSSGSYLINNSQFIEDIPGGRDTVDMLRYVVLGIIGLYVVPILSYSVLFKNFRIIPQILAGVVSFVFYQPTYLIILSTYALCRMDDLSWGTKGLQSGSNNQDNQILTTWKKIRSIHVAKYLFWNVIVASLLIHFGSNYLIRFWLTLVLMGIIGGTMFIKVILAFIYYLYYKCCINTEKIIIKRQQKKKYSIVPCLYKNFQTNYMTELNLERQLRGIIKENVLNLQKLTNVHLQEYSIMALQLIGHSMRPVRRQENTNLMNKNGKSILGDNFIKSINNALKQKSQIIKKNINKQKQRKVNFRNQNLLKQFNRNTHNSNQSNQIDNSAKNFIDQQDHKNNVILSKIEAKRQK